MRSLHQLLGSPDGRNTDGRGEIISRLSGVIYAPGDSVDSADWSRYSSCRGSLAKDSYSRLIDIVTDDSGVFSEDERGDAVNDGIWDWLCHQYTFYSVTPLFLNLLLRRFSATEIPDPDLRHFVELCEQQGTGAIYLSASEIEQNKQGLLPIYRIEDILSQRTRVGNETNSEQDVGEQPAISTSIS